MELNGVKKERKVIKMNGDEGILYLEMSSGLRREKIYNDIKIKNEVKVIRNGE